MNKSRFIRPQGYKKMFMLNSNEHEISIANKNKNREKKTFLAFKLLYIVTIVGILTFMSMIHFMLS